MKKEMNANYCDNRWTLRNAQKIGKWQTGLYTHWLTRDLDSKGLVYPSTDSKSAKQRYIPRSIVVCTPGISNSSKMQEYIQTQTQTDKKQWIYDVINGKRESEHVLLKTDDFVFLPDTEALNSGSVINWLAIFTDKNLKSLRSLHGEHLDVLKTCRKMCTDYIIKSTKFKQNHILAYFHYLPSVFQLHVHFCAPYGLYTTLDVCKIHTLDNVISNLEIDPEYYQKANITTVIIGSGELSSIYEQKETQTTMYHDTGSD